MLNFSAKKVFRGGNKISNSAKNTANNKTKGKLIIFPIYPIVMVSVTNNAKKVIMVMVNAVVYISAKLSRLRKLLNIEKD